MKLGAYTACLHDKPLPEALSILAGMGLQSAEVNSGGFIPEPHLPAADLLAGESARQDYLGIFAEHGMTLTALNCNGNPLDANAARREKHSADLLRSIELAALLGVKRVITMSGTPGTDPAATLPSWNTLTWDSAYLDVRDYQWDVAVAFWRTVQERAAHFDVKVAIEMHPHNLVYNPATLERLVTETNATHVGAEMDPSHLFWQGIEPIEAVNHLGDLVYIAAAKDTRINPRARIHGVLDDTGFVRVGPDEPGAIGLGGPFTLARWPRPSSWDFVAVGRGHDVDWWAGFLAALANVDPEMAVNIEHEDAELGQLEGLESAAKTLLRAAGR
jgi:sugar phosphate isomerase/epimerase